MTRSSSNRPQRWGGSVTVLSALLAIPLVGMLAFSIDIGYIAKVQEECQNAADSGSLAGVSQLDAYAGFSNVAEGGTSNSTDTTLRQNLLQTAVNDAKAEAKRFITTNSAGGVTLSIDSSNDDIDVGYWDPVAKTFTVTSISPPDTNFPNAVRTTIRRDDSNLPYSNGALPLFFARVFGVKTVKVQQPAVAIRHVSIAPPTITGIGGNSYNAGIWVQPYSGPIPTALTGGTAVSSSYTYTDSVTGATITVPPFDPNLLPSGYHSYVLSQ